MTIRSVRSALEQEELTRLSPYAAKACQTRGREAPISSDALRTEYGRDRDRIIHSKGFRRLKGKTQMMLVPLGDHYRTRLTHTLEVSQIARTIARSLRLNEDLTEAISLGHDIGHTPFGHAGERSLDRLYPEGFRHNEQSLRQIDLLENDNAGLNLTYEVRDGILCHTGERLPATLEGWCVRYADRIAYVNHDIDDGIRGGLIAFDELPKPAISVLGSTHGVRIERVIQDIVEISKDAPRVRMSDEVQQASDELRGFLYAKLYRARVKEQDERKADSLLELLYNTFNADASLLPDSYRARCPQDGHARCVVDYIAGMTDQYAMKTFTDMFVPPVRFD
ncbi:MAG: deoxyguanosinetriphosphate triphosphohydrolase [Oscillospiraceae bacterium]|jgi:dGTPase|nr:deoxyguanosinetriphosphate triphosphohydrolase [Oscillospiraceae bacterium]